MASLHLQESGSKKLHAQGTSVCEVRTGNVTVKSAVRALALPHYKQTQGTKPVEAEGRVGPRLVSYRTYYGNSS